MNTENHAQIASLLMLQVNLCVSLKQFMNAQTVREPSPISTEIILSMTETMKAVNWQVRQLATALEVGGFDEFPC